MSVFEGMNARQLKMLFNALDMDGNGVLDRGDLAKLLSKVLEKSVTPAVLDTVFSEMDDNGNVDIDSDEFISFFGDRAGDLDDLSAAMPSKALDMHFSGADADGGSGGGNADIDLDEILSFFDV